MTGISSPREVDRARLQLGGDAAGSRGAKIVFKIGLLTGGGDKPYALGLARSLTERGIPLEFIGSDELDVAELRGNPLVRFLNLRGDQGSHVPLYRKVWRILAYYALLIGWAATTRVKVFHVLWNNRFEIFDRTLLLIYYRLLGKRILFTAHNVNIRKRDGGDTWLNRFTLRVQYRLVDHIFVHTDEMRRELSRDFEVSEERISVIPFPLNDTVPCTEMTVEEARSALGLTRSHKVLLFFGRISSYKGLDLLVEAVLELIRQDPHYHLIIVGDAKGSETYWEGVWARIESAQATERVSRRIEFVPDEETEIFFKAADLLVLPYTRIFQSGVLFLSYNFGLPVLASDVGSFSKNIVEGVTGSIFRSQDPASLASAIACYFASDLYRNLPQHRRGIRAFVEERHSWTNAAEIIGEVYSQL